MTASHWQPNRSTPRTTPMRLALGVVLCLVVGGCAAPRGSAEVIWLERGDYRESLQGPWTPLIRVQPLATDSLPRFDWMSIASAVSYPEFARQRD